MKTRGTRFTIEFLVDEDPSSDDLDTYVDSLWGVIVDLGGFDQSVTSGPADE